MHSDKCPECAGEGVVSDRAPFGSIHADQECSVCNGTGTVMRDDGASGQIVGAASRVSYDSSPWSALIVFGPIVMLSLGFLIVDALGYGTGHSWHPGNLVGTWQLTSGATVTLSEDGTVVLHGEACAPVPADIGILRHWEVARETAFGPKRLMLSGGFHWADYSFKGIYSFSLKEEDRVLELSPVNSVTGAKPGSLSRR